MQHNHNFRIRIDKDKFKKKLGLKDGKDGETPSIDYAFIIERVLNKLPDPDSRDLTREEVDSITLQIIQSLRKQLSSKLEKDLLLQIREAVKKIKPNTIVYDSGAGVPFELPIKSGTNILVRKDASGAYVISSTGGTVPAFADNEVAGGSGTDWTLAHIPTANSEHVYANGQRLIPTVDYTISGLDITTVLSWDAGTVLVDYRY